MHTNRLSQEKSPYLLQHAHNPVDWRPWGKEAFDEAKKRNKPLFRFVCLLTVTTGFLLILKDRLIEFTLKDVFSIKTAVAQADADAKTIAAIKERVENQSATIDLVAQNAQRSLKLSEELNDKIKQTESELSKVKITSSEAAKAVHQLEAVTEFAQVVVAAQNDDRPSLDKLKTWADDSDYPMSQLARQAWIKTRIYYSGEEPKPSATATWEGTVAFTNIPMSELTQLYKQTKPFQHAHLVQQIWARKDVPKRERMAFLIDVMKTDVSISAVDNARKCFYGETDLPKGELATSPIILEPLYQWWEKNKDTLK